MRVWESREFDMAATKKSVEKPEKDVAELFESTVRNLLNTPPKLERFEKKRADPKKEASPKLATSKNA